MKLNFRSTIRKITVLLVILFLYFLIRPAPKLKKDINNEIIKGIWLTNVATAFFHHTTLLDNVFHHVSRSNYNRIYLSIYGGGGTLYPSQQIKSNPVFVPPFTNPLKAAEKEAKRQGLKLYAWLEYGLMLAPKDEIAQKHPDWLLKTNNGDTIVNGFVWLNPENPEVEAYFLNLITEIAQYQELAGIQLDDHWGVPKQFGNKTQALTDLTIKVHQKIKQENPDLILSLSPNPYHFSLNNYNQDWLKWAQNGYIDEVVLQAYRNNNSEFKTAIFSSGVNSIPKNIPVAIGIYTGPENRFLSEPEIKEQIEISKNLGYGFSIFCWEYRLLGSWIEKIK